MVQYYFEREVVSVPVGTLFKMSLHKKTLQTLYKISPLSIKYKVRCRTYIKYQLINSSHGN